jgi:hypothetical protein
LDEAQDVAIRNFGRHRLHDHRMRKVIKEGFDIRVKHDPETSTVEEQSPLDCQMAIATLAKAEGRVVKQAFEERVEEATNYLLGHAVANGRNTQRTKLLFVLRNEDSSQWEGFKGTLL